MSDLFGVSFPFLHRDELLFVWAVLMGVGAVFGLAKAKVLSSTSFLLAAVIFFAAVMVAPNTETPPGTQSSLDTWNILHDVNQRPRIMISGDVLRSHGVPVDEKSMQSAYSMFEDEHIYLFAIWNSAPSLYKVIVAYSQEKEMPLTVSNIDEAVNGGILWDRLRAATEKADGGGDDK